MTPSRSPNRSPSEYTTTIYELQTKGLTRGWLGSRQTKTQIPLVRPRRSREAFSFRGSHLPQHKFVPKRRSSLVLRSSFLGPLCYGPAIPTSVAPIVLPSLTFLETLLPRCFPFFDV